ncbi:MAG: hypothetical protein ACOC9X_05615 [bacterium]
MFAENETYSIGWADWFRWLGLTVAGLVAGFLVFLVVGVTAGEYMDEHLPEFVFGVVLGAIFGSAFGVAHWRFLRRYVPHASSWIPATIVAFALAAAVVFGLLNPQNGDVSLPLRLSHGLAVGLSLGLGQWLVLRSRVAGPAHLWILFSAGAWIAGELTGIALEGVAEGPLALMATFLVGASLSGLGMVWLLRQGPAYQAQPAH